MKVKLLIAVIALGVAHSTYAQRSSRVKELLQIKDSALLEQKLQQLTSSGQEEDVSIVASYYYDSKQTGKAKTLQQEMLQRFPVGRYAYSVTSNAIIRPKSAAEGAKMYQDMVVRFAAVRQTLPDNIKDIPARALAYEYIKEGDTVKSTFYVQQLTDSKTLPTQIFSVANSALKQNQKVFAESLMRKAISIFDTLHLAPNAQDDPLGLSNNRDKYAVSFYSEYASVLAGNGKSAEALVFAKKAYELKKTDATVNTVYAQLLVDQKKYADALPVIEDAIRQGVADSSMLSKYKTAFVAVRGNKGYETKLASLKKEQQAVVTASVKKQMISEPAPLFALKDLQGKTWSLAELKGKTVILDFWATWCGPCKKSFPAMQMAVNKFKNDPSVVFLFIHTWERDANAIEQAGKYITENKYDFNVLMDLKNNGMNEVISSFKAQGIPAKYIIDGKGNIRFKMTGFSGSNESAVSELSAMIEMAKKG